MTIGFGQLKTFQYSIERMFIFNTNMFAKYGSCAKIIVSSM